MLLAFRWRAPRRRRGRARLGKSRSGDPVAYRRRRRAGSQICRRTRTLGTGRARRGSCSWSFLSSSDKQMVGKVNRDFLRAWSGSYAASRDRNTLLVDDMSVDCVIASEVLDKQEFPRSTSKRQRTSQPCTRPMPVRKSSNWCGRRMSVTGLRRRHPNRTWAATVVHPAWPARQARLESRGRPEMNVFAGAGARLRGVFKAFWST